MTEIKYIFGYTKVEVIARGDPYSVCIVRGITKGSKFFVGQEIEAYNRSLYPEHKRGGKLYGGDDE